MDAADAGFRETMKNIAAALEGAADDLALHAARLKRDVDPQTGLLMIHRDEAHGFLEAAATVVRMARNGGQVIRNIGAWLDAKTDDAPQGP